jgi:hypothetical protein
MSTEFAPTKRYARASPAAIAFYGGRAAIVQMQTGASAACPYPEPSW